MYLVFGACVVFVVLNILDVLNVGVEVTHLDCEVDVYGRTWLLLQLTHIFNLVGL